MGRLEPDLTPTFKRDIKRLDRKHVDTKPLVDVMELVLTNSKRSEKELKRRHNMHKLKGEWAGSLECHVANFGDWLLIWCIEDNYAIFQRTGSHDELFR